MSSRVKLWISRIFTGIITMALVATAIMKIAHVPKMVDGLTHAGLPEGAIIPIAVLELSCLALYLVPRTMVLGAVLLTGYFGGAIVVHIIGGESVFPVVLMGLWVWGGIYFRVPALQALLPLQRGEAGATADLASRPDILAGRNTAAARS
jgi:DoxX-like protein